MQGLFVVSTVTYASTKADNKNSTEGYVAPRKFTKSVNREI